MSDNESPLPACLAAFPLFAKPVDGKYSLNVIRDDSLDAAAKGDVQLRGSPSMSG